LVENSPFRSRPPLLHGTSPLPPGLSRSGGSKPLLSPKCNMVQISSHLSPLFARPSCYVCLGACLVGSRGPLRGCPVTVAQPRLAKSLLMQPPAGPFEIRGVEIAPKSSASTSSCSRAASGRKWTVTNSSPSLHAGWCRGEGEVENGRGSFQPTTKTPASTRYTL